MDVTKDKTGDSTVGVADQQPGADAAAAAVPQSGDQVPVAGEDQTQNMIPKERLDQEIEKRKTAEQQTSFLQQQMQLLQFQAQQQPQPQQQADPYGNLNDDDYVNVGMFKRMSQQQAQQQAQQLQALQLQVNYPDAANTINTHLKTALANNPTLMTTITNSADRYTTMYLIAKNQELISEAQQRQQTAQQTVQQTAQQTAQELLENKNRPLPASAVGGAIPVTGVDRFLNMTDEELAAENERVKREGAKRGL